MSSPKSNRLRKVLKTFFILDVLWACMTVTMNAIIMNGIVNAADVGAATTVTDTVLSWLSVFFVGLLQGAIVIIVIGGCIFIGITVSIWAEDSIGRGSTK